MIEHMPKAHAEHLLMTPEKIMDWAANVGEQASELTSKLLERKEHSQQTFKAILGVMRLGKTHGEKRLEAACGTAIRMNSLRVRYIKMLLETKKDHTLFDGVKEEEEDKPIQHKNIRGGKKSNKKTKAKKPEAYKSRDLKKSNSARKGEA